jgi:hypothetical protein
VNTAERPLLLERQGAEVVPRATRVDAVEVLEGGRAKDIEDEGELVVVCCKGRVSSNCATSGKTENIQSRPGKRGRLEIISAMTVKANGESVSLPGGSKTFKHSLHPMLQISMALVYCLNLLGEPSRVRFRLRWSQKLALNSRQHDLGSPVPPRCHILRHEARLSAIGFSRLSRTSEAEIADLEIAVGVEEEVGGLEIAVDDVGRVESFDGTEGLVGKVLDAEWERMVSTERGGERRAKSSLVVGEVLSTNDAMKIRLHELLDEVDLFRAKPVECERSARRSSLSAAW